MLLPRYDGLFLRCPAFAYIVPVRKQTQKASLCSLLVIVYTNTVFFLEGYFLR